MNHKPNDPKGYLGCIDPYLSLIIPCHNLEMYIGRCLRSIASQTLGKSLFEVVLVFDSCTDNTKNIAIETLKKHEVSFRTLDVDVSSPGLARNAGLEISRGKFIWFIDGDDYLTNDEELEKLISAMESEKTDAIYMKNVESDGFIYDTRAAWRYFYRRDIIGNVRFSGKRMNKDWEFTERVSQNTGYSQHAIGDVFYHYTFPRKGSVLDELFRDARKNIGKCFGGKGR